jgi:hypothetical protein
MGMIGLVVARYTQLTATADEATYHDRQKLVDEYKLKSIIDLRTK